MDLSYILNVLGEERSEYFNAVSPPVFQTSNFAFPDTKSLQAAMRDESQSHLYTRGNNPTVEILRKKMAALEETEDALIFSSGVAAISAAVMHAVKNGDHVICTDSPYSWTVHLLKNILSAYGVETTFVDGCDTSAFEKAIRQETKMIYLESPDTFHLNLQDLEALSGLAHAHGITTIIDNSYCTPLYQQPHTLGIDLVVHTATKYLAGHSDVLAGVVCGNKTHIHAIFRNEFMTFGAVPSPHDAWLFLRGLRTLPMRLERSASNAEEIIKALEGHPAIEAVIYPTHSSHAQQALAQKQMRRASGLFAILLKTDQREKVEAFCNTLQRFLLAVSWGGYESLVFPACIKEDTSYPVNYVRLYAGLEDASVLIADIAQALHAIY